MDYKEWAFHDVSPIYLQLYEKLTHSILNGKLCPCEDIPSIQQMAAILKISSSIVARAYQLVNQQKLIIHSNRQRYKVTPNVLFIQQKRNEAGKTICFTSIHQMLELEYIKEKILAFINEYLENHLNTIENN